MTDHPDRDGDGKGDGERDAWLREALRHAPDSALAPPALLRDAILAQARAAVATPAGRAPSRQNAWATLWTWLARPPVAAGFASVMAATLVGMMWWDRPLDETMAPPLAQRAPAAVSDVAAPAPSAPAAPTATATATPSPAPAATRPPAATTTAKQAARDLPDTPAASPAARPRRDSALAFPAEAREKNAAAAVDTQDAMKRPAAGNDASASPPAVRPRSTGSTGSNDSTGSTLAGAAGTADERMRERAQDRPRERDANAFAQAPARRAEPAATMRKGDAAPPSLGSLGPLAPLLAELAADAPRWSRIGADGRALPVDEALRRWLAELDAASAGRWRLAAVPMALPARPEGAGAGQRETPAIIELQRDGRPIATLSLDVGAASLDSRVDGPARSWRAELAPAAVERLLRTVPRLPP